MFSPSDIEFFGFRLSIPPAAIAQSALPYLAIMVDRPQRIEVVFSEFAPSLQGLDAYRCPLLFAMEPAHVDSPPSWRHEVSTTVPTWQSEKKQAVAEMRMRGKVAPCMTGEGLIMQAAINEEVTRAAVKCTILALAANRNQKERKWARPVPN
jgi:hypothetical protein